LVIPPSQGKNHPNVLLKAILDAQLFDSKYLKAKVTLDCFELNADLPMIEEQISKGLSVKDKLRENESMLFEFEEPSRQTIMNERYEIHVS
jgi:hypothetical protein